MKTIKSIFSFITTTLFVVCLISCGQSQISFTAYTSNDGSYVLEIPSDVPKYRCEGKIMSFKNDQTFITIQPMLVDNIEEYVAKDKYKGNFDYELIQSSDTSSFYKITKGANMFSAYQLYMLKNFGGERYLISVSSIENKSMAIEIITHIYFSLKKKNDQGHNGYIESDDKTYSNNFFFGEISK